MNEPSDIDPNRPPHRSFCFPFSTSRTPQLNACPLFRCYSELYGVLPDLGLLLQGSRAGEQIWATVVVTCVGHFLGLTAGYQLEDELVFVC